MSDSGDNLFDDGDEEDESSSNSGASGTESGDGKDSKSADKRISDLQSARDKETARANKLQKQLDAIAVATKGGGVEDGKPSGDSSSGGNVMDDAILDMARMFAFQQNPKLAEYGVSVSDLNGGTPSDIARVATELVARFEKIETQVRNKVLADNGMAPELEAGATGETVARDFSKMSKEDFDKVVATALGRR